MTLKLNTSKILFTVLLLALLAVPVLMRSPVLAAGAIPPADAGVQPSLCYVSTDFKQPTGFSDPSDCSTFTGTSTHPGATKPTVFLDGNNKTITGTPKSGCFLEVQDTPQLTFRQNSCKTLNDQLAAWQAAHSQTSPTSTPNGLNSRPQCNDPNNVNACVSTSPIIKLLKTFINFLAAGVGIVAVISLIIAGIQYSTAGDNPTATANAKKRIMNTVIGLLAFMFMWAFLQWLIPGGILQ